MTSIQPNMITPHFGVSTTTKAKQSPESTTKKREISIDPFQAAHIKGHHALTIDDMKKGSTFKEAYENKHGTLDTKA